MPTLADRLASATEMLRAVSETPRIDAEYLLAHALGCSRAQLLTRLNESIEPATFNQLLERRLTYEPVPYILGVWEFFSMELAVRAPMLVPRPETEHLVEAVLDVVGLRPCRVLELGTGTGCISLAIAKNAPHCKIVATDINPEALRLASENMGRHRLDDRVSFYGGDLFQSLQTFTDRFDVICSNPPYVEDAAWEGLPPAITRYEDPRALVAGQDGLDVIRRIVAEAPKYLVSGGFLAFEIGMGQHDAVKSLLEQYGYENIAFENDLQGIARVACAKTK
jgi:release factor glutamine methyltransferase